MCLICGYNRAVIFIAAFKSVYVFLVGKFSAWINFLIGACKGRAPRLMLSNLR